MKYSFLILVAISLMAERAFCEDHGNQVLAGAAVAGASIVTGGLSDSVRMNAEADYQRALRDSRDNVILDIKSAPTELNLQDTVRISKNVMEGDNVLISYLDFDRETGQKITDLKSEIESLESEAGHADQIRLLEKQIETLERTSDLKPYTHLLVDTSQKDFRRELQKMAKLKITGISIKGYVDTKLLVNLAKKVGRSTKLVGASALSLIASTGYMIVNMERDRRAPDVSNIPTQNVQ